MISELLKERNELRKNLTDYTNLLVKLSNKDKQLELSELRKISIETIEKHNIFWVGNAVEMMIPEYISLLVDFGLISNTNNKPIFNNRWVIPIYDKDNMVQALVGYSNIADVRYVYSTTKFYLRGDTLYGEEQLNQTYKDGYAVLVEGITDALHIKDLGFNNIYANCGTRKGEINFLRLNRLKYGFIRIPDRDSAGERTKRTWVTDRYITLVTPPQFKDSDEVLRDERYIEVFKEYLSMSIGMLKDDDFKLNNKVELNFI